MYPEKKFIRDNVVAPFVLHFIIIITLSLYSGATKRVGHTRYMQIRSNTHAGNEGDGYQKYVNNHTLAR